jgi:hypothetical protein
MDNLHSYARHRVLRLFAPLRLSLAIALFWGYPAQLSADPLATERTIIELAQSWHEQMQLLSESKVLVGFCASKVDQQTIFNLLDEIHHYHDLLEADLESTPYNHSRRTIRRILKEIDKLSTDFPPEDFAEFFREQCWLRSRTEKKARTYNTGFGTHSYGGQVHTQEAVTEWYLNRLTRRISRIKRHVEHFHAKQLAVGPNLTPVHRGL